MRNGWTALDLIDAYELVYKAGQERSLPTDSRAYEAICAALEAIDKADTEIALHIEAVAAQQETNP